jgi:hypothetical protein
VSEGPFFPPREFRRLFRLAVLARVRELTGLGIPGEDAKAQANKEFQAYDLVELDDRGWVRMRGASPRRAPRQPTRATQPRRALAPLRRRRST